MLRIIGRGVALVVVERDGPLGDIEGEVAISTVVVFPTAMRVGEKVVDEAFDDLGDADARAVGLRLIPHGFSDLDRTFRHWYDDVAGFHLDVLDLAAVAVAVEGDDDERDAGGRERLEQRGLVEWLQLSVQPILGGALALPIGRHAVVGGWNVGSMRHGGLLKRKRPARCPGEVAWMEGMSGRPVPPRSWSLFGGDDGRLV